MVLCTYLSSPGAHRARSRARLLAVNNRRPSQIVCIPSTFDWPVEKHCNRLCLPHRRVTIGSTQRSIEILSYIKINKKTCAGIGLGRYWSILRIRGIGSVLKKLYLCIPTPEPAPVQEPKEPAPEPAPVWEPTDSAPEPTPVQEPTKSAPEPTPVREPTGSAPESVPVREPTGSAPEPTPEPAPVRETTEPAPEPTPVQEPTKSTPEPTPIREPTGSAPESEWWGEKAETKLKRCSCYWTPTK